MTEAQPAILKPKPKTMTVGDYQGKSPERPPQVHRVIPERKAALSIPKAPEPPKEQGLDPEVAAFLADMGEDGEPAQPDAKAKAEPAKEPEGDDIDIDAIKARFKKEDPKELADLLAKSYGNAEKAMRQAQSERDLLRQLLQKDQMQPATQPGQPAPQAQPVMVPKVEVKPWDKETFGKTFLDDIPGKMDEFRQHVLGEAQAWAKQVISPLYLEAIENKVHRKYPGLVTEESWPLIVSLAQQQQGATDLEKAMKAAELYKNTFGQHLAKGSTAEVDAMKEAAAQPGPKAKTGGSGKIYTKEWIKQKFMTLRPGSPEYVAFAKQVQKAYDQKRVR